MKTVFVVMQGEHYEGGSVVGVFDNEDAAVKAALGVETHFAGGWAKDSDTYNRWNNGCDFVDVSKYEVQS